MLVGDQADYGLGKLADGDGLRIKRSLWLKLVWWNVRGVSGRRRGEGWKEWGLVMRRAEG